MRILIWLLLAYLVYRMVRGKKNAELPRPEKTPATETFQDPVCGVYVPLDDAVVGRLGDKRYYFCSMACLEQFEKDQQKR